MLGCLAVASEPVRLVEPVRFGEDFELDLRAYALRRGDRTLKLERIPMDLLVLLVEHRGELVTREQIQTEIWGNGTFVDFEHGLNFCIKQIRATLDDDAEKPLYIQTLPRRGYRFVAPVDQDAGAAPAHVTGEMGADLVAHLENGQWSFKTDREVC